MIAAAVMVLSPWAVSLVWMRAAGMERNRTQEGADQEKLAQEWNWEGEEILSAQSGAGDAKGGPAGEEENQEINDGEEPAKEVGGQAVTGAKKGETEEEQKEGWGGFLRGWGRGSQGEKGAETGNRGELKGSEGEGRVQRKILVERKGIQTYIDLEDYLPGVMVCQLDGDYSRETLKCQAVIARTYIYRLLNGRTEIYEEELDMDYLGEGGAGLLADREKLLERLERCREAAEATKGMVMKYEDRYILPLFHAVSAGRTRAGDGDFPYLQSVESVSDTKREDYMEIPEWSLASFAAAISQIPGGIPVEAEQLPGQIQTVKRDDAGYVVEMKIGAGTYSGDQIQYALGLSSPCFNIEAEGDRIRVRVRGKGHGYGLSQAGADSMAESGWGYEDILNHYYKNISLIFE